MEVLGGKIGEGVVRYWPPTNSFLLFGYVCANFGENRSRNATWECSQTDTHTQTQTDFI